MTPPQLQRVSFLPDDQALDLPARRQSRCAAGDIDSTKSFRPWFMKRTAPLTQRLVDAFQGLQFADDLFERNYSELDGLSERITADRPLLAHDSSARGTSSFLSPSGGSTIIWPLSRRSSITHVLSEIVTRAAPPLRPRATLVWMRQGQDGRRCDERQRGRCREALPARRVEQLPFLSNTTYVVYN